MSTTLDNIITHLNDMTALQHYAKEQHLGAAVANLQEWQCTRLLATHDDLWRHKRFKPAMQFFVDELYGPKDFTQRDEDIARVVPKMATVLPEKALRSLESALHLNTLSFKLDIRLTEQLGGQTVNRDSYAQAYRACENYQERKEQIEYIHALGDDLAGVVDIRGISALLMLSRKPAKMAGFIALHEFLEQGFKAFKKLGNVSDFMDPIITREKALMEALFHENTSNPLPEGI